MCTPSRSSYPLSYPRPFGQMMLTSWPAARSACASCHTRRSKGQGRFSTIMRTRHLPGDAVIPFHVGAARAGGPVRCADKVDDRLPWRQLLQQRRELTVCGGDHHHLGVLEKLLGSIHQQPSDMGNVIEDVLAVRPEQAREP